MSLFRNTRNAKHRFTVPKDARPYKKGWLCKCPAHEDTNPSFIINVKQDGSHYGHCLAGCTWDDLKPYAERYYD
ncbi:MAG: Uncharacterised protein [SAR116 cluster bacterium MED-G04]|nr:MAG: Uncharacterised protein [SAR116 cluster bacterium MED-G04]